jgi:modulator of FtsH protease HflK
MKKDRSHLDPLERSLLEIKEMITRFLPQQSFWSILLGIIVLFGVFGSFYTVQPDEEAVVLRLGRYTGTKGPGLQFKLPYAIDRVFKLQTKQILQEEFGFRTISSSGRTSEYQKRGHRDESLMLTGDLNIAEVEWVVQFQIADPYKFLFATSNPQKNIRDVSEAIIRRVVGDRLVNSVFERTGMAAESKTLIQDILDRYEMGVRIVAIEFQDVLPPELVRPSFNEVNAARQELEKLINQAEARYNKVIPEARGKAEQTVAQAEGQAQAIINKARGEGEKFKSMLTEYRRAPQVTKDRLYLEAMEGVFSRVEKVRVVDANVNGLLPIFDPPQMQRASP